MTFSAAGFRNRGGSLSEKLATVFDSIGASETGEANTADVGKVFGIGSISATKSITPASGYVPLQISVTSIADHGTSGDEGIGACYLKSAATTAHQPNHQLATCMVRTGLAKNIWDAYGLQSHLAISASMQSTGDNAHLTAISGKVTFSNTPTVAKGWVTAGLFIAEGAGTCTQMCHVVSGVVEAATTGVQSIFHAYSDVDIMAALSFSGVQDTGHMIDATDHSTGASSGGIRILVNGAAAYIPYDLV